MSQNKKTFSVSFSIITGAVSSIFGKIQGSFETLIVIMIINYVIAQFANYIISHTHKDITINVISQKGIIGLMKKVIIILIILGVKKIDTSLLNSRMLEDCMINAYIVNEVLGIVEFSKLLEIPVPSPINKMIEILKKHTDYNIKN